MEIILYEPPIDLDPNSTGFKLRQCRQGLGLTAKELSKLSGVSKSQILQAERNVSFLNRSHYGKVCTALKINPDIIMDNEYKFFYEGYGQVIEYLINKIGIYSVLESLQVNRTKLLNWKSGRWIPQLDVRRALIRLYNELHE